jgi:transposase
MMTTMTENTEVRRARRSWPAKFKLEILAEIDQAKATDEPGAVGAIMRRENLYSSLISEWRHQRDAGALAGLGNKGGRPRIDPARDELARLRGECERLQGELDTANELIEAQGKVSALLQTLSRKSANKNSTT